MFGPAANLDRYIIDHAPNLSELTGHIPESVAEQHQLHQAILERDYYNRKPTKLTFVRKGGYQYIMTKVHMY